MDTFDFLFQTKAPTEAIDAYERRMLAALDSVARKATETGKVLGGVRAPREVFTGGAGGQGRPGRLTDEERAQRENERQAARRQRDQERQRQREAQDAERAARAKERQDERDARAAERRAERERRIEERAARERERLNDRAIALKQKLADNEERVGRRLEQIAEQSVRQFRRIEEQRAREAERAAKRVERAAESEARARQRFLGGLAQAGSGALRGGLGGLQQGIGSLGLPAIREATRGITGLFEGLRRSVGFVNVRGGLFTGLANAAASSVAVVTRLFANMGGNILRSVGLVASGAVKLLAFIPITLTRIVGGAISGLTTGLTVALGPVAGAISAGIGGALQAAAGIATQTVTVIGDVLQGLGRLAAGVFEGVARFAATALEGIVRIATKVVNTTARILTGLVDVAGRVFGRVLSTVTTWAAGATAAVVGFFTVATKKAADFEAQMVGVFTRLERSTPQLERALSGLAANVTVRFNIPTEDVARGLETAIEGGFSPEEIGVPAFEQLIDASARLAKQQRIELAQAVRLVTTSMRLFGDESLTAAQRAEVLFQTLRQGVLEPEDLNRSYAALGARAKVTGDSFVELSRLIVLATKTAGDRRTALDGLRQAFETLINPSREVQEQLRSLGIESQTSAGTARPLTQVLRELAQVANRAGGESAIANIFSGSKEAVNAILLLRQNFRALSDDVARTVSANGNALERASDRTLGVLRERFGAFGKALGQALKGFGTPLLEPAARLFGNLTGIVQRAGARLSGVLGRAFNIGGLSRSLTEAVDRTTQRVEARLNDLIDGLPNLINRARDFARNLGASLSGFREGADRALENLRRFGDGASRVFKDLSGLSFDDAFKSVREGRLDIVFDGLRLSFSKVSLAAKNAAADILDAIAQVVEPLGNTLGRLAGDGTRTFLRIKDAALEFGASVLDAIDSIVGSISPFVTAISGAVSVLGKVRSVAADISSSIERTLEKVLQFNPIFRVFAGSSSSPEAQEERRAQEEQQGVLRRGAAALRSRITGEAGIEDIARRIEAGIRIPLSGRGPLIDPSVVQRLEGASDRIRTAAFEQHKENVFEQRRIQDAVKRVEEAIRERQIRETAPLVIQPPLSIFPQAAGTGPTSVFGTRLPPPREPVSFLRPGAGESVFGPRPAGPTSVFGTPLPVVSGQPTRDGQDRGNNLLQDIAERVGRQTDAFEGFGGRLGARLEEIERSRRPSFVPGEGFIAGRRRRRREDLEDQLELEPGTFERFGLKGNESERRIFRRLQGTPVNQLSTFGPIEGLFGGEQVFTVSLNRLGERFAAAAEALDPIVAKLSALGLDIGTLGIDVRSGKRTGEAEVLKHTRSEVAPGPDGRLGLTGRRLFEPVRVPAGGADFSEFLNLDLQAFGRGESLPLQAQRDRVHGRRPRRGATVEELQASAGAFGAESDRLARGPDEQPAIAASSSLAEAAAQAAEATDRLANKTEAAAAAAVTSLESMRDDTVRAEGALVEGVKGLAEVVASLQRERRNIFSSLQPALAEAL